MARRQTTRKLQVFQLNAHLNDSVAQYEDFFSDLSSLNLAQRRVDKGDEVLFLDKIAQVSGLWRLKIYEGDRDVLPLIIDTSDGSSRVENLTRSEFLAQPTHAILDLGTRYFVVEYNHRGAKAKDLAFFFEEISTAQLGYADASFELLPVPGKSFLTELDQMKRVRLATVRFARPNIEWTDHKAKFSEIASASDAKAIEVSTYAKRGKSLRKKRGLLEMVANIIRGDKDGPPLENARITGTRSEDSAEVTISLDKHIEHRKVRVGLTDDGHVIDNEIEDKITKFLRQRLGEGLHSG